MSVSTAFFSILTAALLTSSPNLNLILTDMERGGKNLSIVSVKPGSRIVLGSLDVLPGVEPFARLSEDGRSVFLVRHTSLNHPEQSARLYRFDLLERRWELIAEGADAAPPLPLGPASVAWIRTLNVHPVSEERAAAGELFSVDVEIRASAAGREVILCRLDGIYGAHFAGAVSGGIILYIVSRREAAFYLLPLERSLADRSAGKIRGFSRLGSVSKAPVESSDAEAVPSGIIRLARAPEGPFARDFAVSENTLFFGSLSLEKGEREKALYALDVTAPDDLLSEDRTGVPERHAVKLESTGAVHPVPAVSPDGRLFFSRADDSSAEERRHLISRVHMNSEFGWQNSPEIAGISALERAARSMEQFRMRWLRLKRDPGMTEEEAGMRLEAGSETSKSAGGDEPLVRSEVLRLRGRGRVAAVSEVDETIAVERIFDSDRRDAFGEPEKATELLWIDAEQKRSFRIPAGEVRTVLGFSQVAP